MTTLPEALTLAGYSFPVIPIKPRGKTPVCAHGCKDGTTEIDQLTQWFSGNNYNIAVCTGKDLLILDIDGEEGIETLRNLEAIHGKLPETPEVTTGGGGTHYYFKPPCELPSSIAKLGPGVDIRCRGGYAVAPPSIHHSGNAYEWAVLPTDCPLAPLPEWIVDKLAPEPSEPAKAPIMPDQFERIFDWYTTKAYYALEANEPRHSTLFDLSCQLRDNGCPRDLCEEVILYFAQHYRHTKRGEFTDIEAVKIVRDVYSKEPRNPSPLDIVKAPEVTIPKDSWEPISLEYCMKPPAPTQWLVKDMLAVKDLVLVSAQGGIGKTNMLLDMAICVAAGKPWLEPLNTGTPVEGLKTFQVPTLFYGSDTDADTICSRIGGMLRDHSLPTSIPFYPILFPEPRLNACVSLEKLEAKIVRFGCKLVVIDNLTTVTLGGDRNDGNVAGAVLTAFRQLSQKTGCAVIIIHHHNKTGQYSGNHTLRDLVDFTYDLRREGDNIIISSDKVRTTAPPPAIGARWVYSTIEGDTRALLTCSLRGVPVMTGKDMEIRAKITEVIRKAGAIGITSTALQKAVGGRGQTCQINRDALVEEGVIVATKKGSTTRYSFSQGV